MKCDLCHSVEASIFIEQMSGNVLRKASLCEKCALRHGITAPTASRGKMDVDSVFKELDALEREADPESKVLCPICGKPLAEIKESGAGCAECYEVFKNEIQLQLERERLNGTYTGTLPKRLPARNLLPDRSYLLAKLDQAVQAEQYEKAAVYRDYLKLLERGLSDGEDYLDYIAALGGDCDDAV